MTQQKMLAFIWHQSGNHNHTILKMGGVTTITIAKYL